MRSPDIYFCDNCSGLNFVDVGFWLGLQLGFRSGLGLGLGLVVVLGPGLWLV